MGELGDLPHGRGVDGHEDLLSEEPPRLGAGAAFDKGAAALAIASWLEAQAQGRFFAHVGLVDGLCSTRGLHVARQALPRAAGGRLAEFAAGRAAAAEAMRRAGLPDIEIGRDARGAPVWPDATVGAITHAVGLAGAIVAPRAICAGLGLDLERRQTLEPAVARLISRPEEWLDPSVELSLARFCIKEAIYKAIYPSVGRYVDFQEAQVRFDADGQGFEARLIGAQSEVSGLTGVWTQAEGWVAALCVVSPGQAGGLRQWAAAHPSEALRGTAL